MSRSMTSSVISTLDDATIRPFYLFYSEFEGTTLRLCSLSRDIAWDSQTWLGNGWFRGMSSIRETGNVESTGVEVILSGVPSTIVSLALSYARQNLPGIIYLGLFDSSYAIISDPFVLWEGGFDVAKIRTSQNETVVTLSYESHLASLRRRKEVRYTDQQQKLLYPGDRGFEFAAGLEGRTIYWGNKETELAL